MNNILFITKEFRSRYTAVRSRYTSLHRGTFYSWERNLDPSIPQLDQGTPLSPKKHLGLGTLLPQSNLDQSIPPLSCLDHSIPPLSCLDHSIPFRSRYTVGTVWVLDQSYSVQNCLDLGIRNFLDQNPHPFLDLSHRDLTFASSSSRRKPSGGRWVQGSKPIQFDLPREPDTV